MKALVTGGNGFIGSHLVDALVSRGWEVVILDLYDRRFDVLPKQVRFVRGDLSQAYLLRETLTGMDVVFHLAWSTIHEVSNQDPAADVTANLIPSIHLIEESQRANVQRIVFASSGGTVYGPAREFPIGECHETNPISAYGITKLAVEKYLHMFNRLYGLENVILRPSVPYGPRQSPLGRQGAVAVFLHRVAHGMPVSIWGDGTTVRDYFYISDLIDALISAATCELDRSRVFNIGGGQEISLNQLVNAVETTVGKKALVEYQPMRSFDVPRIALDTRLARNELGWRARVTLEAGLKKTWRWLSTNL